MMSGGQNGSGGGGGPGVSGGGGPSGEGGGGVGGGGGNRGDPHRVSTVLQPQLSPANSGTVTTTVAATATVVNRPPINREMSESTWETFTEYDNQAAHAQHVARLHMLCDAASEDDEDSWNAIREWIDSNRHNESILLAGAETLGDYATTPLHLACRNCPPVDIVQRLLEIAPHTVQMTDSFSWLPLHYACANGASVDVLRILADRYPESKTASDKRGRTPLHFALGNTQRPASPEVVELLVSTGAAGCHDENGMLPLHYACAYGISREALSVLTGANPESVTATDNKGRTPLHFALGNADRAASPSVVQHLLSEKQEVVNSTDKDGQLPLHLLSTQANRLLPDARTERTNAKKCLELYLKADPRATADFFTALQSLPRFLRDIAVVTPLVQHVLNNKISKRFPTMILMLDFIFIVLIIVCFRLAVSEMIDILFCRREDEVDAMEENLENINSLSYNCPLAAVNALYLFFLYLGGTYFLVRETVQVISLASLSLFKTWLFDLTNILDVLCIVIVFFWTIVMTVGTFPADQFRSGTAISTGILWCLVLSFLKSTLIDFAVFVGGVFYVVRRLAAFLMALAVILVAFAQMFLTVFQGTAYCECLEATDVQKSTGQCTPCPDETKKNCEYESPDDYRPFCYFWTSLLKVYTMLLGEVDETDFSESAAATWLFVVFMFLVVILLANVLIAIVTDSYGVIKNQRAQIVFWSNRLDFVAEIDLISTGPWTKRLSSIFCCTDDVDDIAAAQAEREQEILSKDTFGQGMWKQLLALYDDQDLAVLSVEFWCYLVFRVTAALFIIPSWLLIGLGSAGFLWPPQVREWLFVQRISKRKQGDTLAEQRLIQMNELKAEVKRLQEEIKVEMTSDRAEVDGMKVQLSQMKSEMTTEMKQIKEIMTMLFDMQSSSG